VIILEQSEVAEVHQFIFVIFVCSAVILLVLLQYQKRISGPLLDRIDIHVKVPEVDYEKLSSDWVGEISFNP